MNTRKLSIYRKELERHVGNKAVIRNVEIEEKKTKFDVPKKIIIIKMGLKAVQVNTGCSQSEIQGTI